MDQPLKLSAGVPRSVRQQDNSEAIGGMKDPMISLHRVHGHRKVGDAVSKLLDGFIRQHPEVQEGILKAVGDTWS